MDHEYGTPITPRAAAYLRRVSSGRPSPARRGGRLIAVLGIGGAVALMVLILVVSFATPPPTVVKGETTYRSVSIGSVSFERPEGWAASKKDSQFYGPVLFYAPIIEDVNLPPTTIELNATIADPERLVACGVPITEEDGGLSTPPPGAKPTTDVLACLAEGLINDGAGNGPLPRPDATESFIYGVNAEAESGIGNTALELRWTKAQLPWMPYAEGELVPTPLPTFEGMVIPSDLLTTEEGPRAEYPRLGAGVAINPANGLRYDMNYLMALYLPRRGTFDGPKRTRRFLVVTLAYPAGLDPNTSAELEAIFRRMTRSLSFS